MEKADRFTTVIQAVQAEQRRHSRRSVSLSVRVFWQGESADLIEAPGLVRDISVNGFGIELAQRLRQGELLSVQTTAGALQGVVRHVRPLEGGFLVGMEILLASDGGDHQRSLRNLQITLAEAEKSR